MNIKGIINNNRAFLEYLSADILVKGFLFISMPLLAHMMSVDNYGMLSLLSAAISILYVFFSLNISSAVSNRYMKTKECFGQYLFSCLSFILVFQFVLIICFPVYSKNVSDLFGLSELDILYCIVICVGLTFINVYFSYLIASKQSNLFSKVNIVSKLIELALLFVLVYLLVDEQYLSKVYAQLLVTAIVLAWIIPRLKNILVMDFSLPLLISALTFSLPLIVHVLSNNLLAQVDRVIIVNILGVKEAGEYSLVYNLSIAILVIIMSWNSSWQPRLFELINVGEFEQIKKNIYRTGLYMFCATSVFMMFSYEIVFLVVPHDYDVNIRVVLPIVMGVSMIYVYMSYVNFSFYQKKSITISINTLVSVVINIWLNYMFIPQYGIIGAAWATFIAYCMLCLLNYILMNRSFKEAGVSFYLFICYAFGLLFVYFVCILLDSALEYIYILPIKILLVAMLLVFSVTYDKRTLN